MYRGSGTRVWMEMKFFLVRSNLINLSWSFDEKMFFHLFDVAKKLHDINLELRMYPPEDY